MRIELGWTVKDAISGYEGIAESRAEYLNGCVRIVIASTKLTKSGEPQDGRWFDEGQLEVVSKKLPKFVRERIEAAIAEPPGGPRGEAAVSNRLVR